LFGGSQASPACLSGKSSIKMKMNMEHWWDDADRGKPNIRRRTCPSATLSTTNSNGLARHQSRASAVRGRQLAA
jgi:hypothetical protein